MEVIKTILMIIGLIFVLSVLAGLLIPYLLVLIGG